jgi:hypothetical protein
MTVPTGQFGTAQFENNAFTPISLFSDDEEIVRDRTKMSWSCTRFVQTEQYN